MANPTQAPADGHLLAIRNDIEGLLKEVYRLNASVTDTKKAAHEEHKKLLLGMLEVLDGFERVLGNIEPKLETADRQAQSWAGSFRSVYKLLNRELRGQGVELIESPERKVVPGFHNVVETREDLDLDNGTIVEEWKHGYMWRGEVLRMAEVVAIRN